MESAIIVTGTDLKLMFDDLKTFVAEEIGKATSKGEISPADRLLSRAETAKMLGVSKVTLWEYTRSGKLQSYRLGKFRRYKETEVFAALKEIKTA